MEGEEDAYVFEREGESMESQEEEEEDIMESESEGEEEEEDEAEQLEEMRPPVFTSWMGPDGITVDKIMCIDDGIIVLKNRCQLDDCSICYQPPSTTHSKHQICCLPCGHMYGFSCIKRWLLQSSSSGKCPQCNSLCTIQDALLLYPQPLCVTAHQKAPLTAFFPLTQQGFLEFKEYETSRAVDALLLMAHDFTHINILVRKHNDLLLRSHELARQSNKLLTQADDIEERPESLELVDRALLQAHDLKHMNIFVTKRNVLVLTARELTRQSDNLLTQAEELEERPESLGLADALRRQARLLKPRIDALGRRTDALKRLISALRRQSDSFKQRSDAIWSRLEFFAQMYREHVVTKKNNNEPCSTCMEKKDKNNMQAFEGPKEEPVEDVAEEHEEETV